jgi:tRNA(Ile)-lysidine synthase
VTRPALFSPVSLPPGPLVVAVSGGLDSMVLLHYLRFGAGRAGDLQVAHLDHAMRAGSQGDADWVAGVCRAWELPLHTDRLAVAPSGEEEARVQRHRFLNRVRSRTKAAAVVTAHHADDQAETVLFRVLRGTGVNGLGGMASVSDGLARPLLGRWRTELEAYAEQHAVPHRWDATNDDVRYARNALRNLILPAAEARVAAGSRRSLVRLAENAARHREELRELEAWVFRDAIEEVSPGRAEVSAALIAELPVPLRRRVLRRAAERVGVVLSHAGTRQATRALDELQVGKGLDLTGGMRLVRARDRWIFLVPDDDGATAEAETRGWCEGHPRSRVVLSHVGEGSRLLRLGAVSWRVEWSPVPLETDSQVELPASLDRPLTLRGWSAGDRIRLSYGSKSVARLLSEVGVPVPDRPGSALAVDAADRVLWVPGVAVSSILGEGSESSPGGERTYLACARVHHG